MLIRLSDYRETSALSALKKSIEEMFNSKIEKNLGISFNCEVLQHYRDSNFIVKLSLSNANKCSVICFPVELQSGIPCINLDKDFFDQFKKQFLLDVMR